MSAAGTETPRGTWGLWLVIVVAAVCLTYSASYQVGRDVAMRRAQLRDSYYQASYERIKKWCDARRDCTLTTAFNRRQQ